MNRNILISFAFIAILVCSAISLTAQQISEFTDEGKIYASVRKKFTQWMEKGEFEREADWRQRLKDNSLTALKQIYGNVVDTAIIENWTYFGFDGILTYDTENELFSVSFTRYYGNNILSSFISVPLNEAPEFKERWNMSEKEYVRQDWCFVNHTLYPKTISCTIDGKTYTFPIYKIEYYSETFIAKDFKEISLTFNNLGINNEHLRGVVVPYSEIETQITQKQEPQIVEEKNEWDDILPFAIVEEKPMFQNKDAGEFAKWIYSQPQYKEALSNNIQGTFRVSFTVNIDGTLSDIKSLRKVDPILEECVIELVKKSPKWTPGRQQNKPVKVTYQVPISF